MTEETTLNALRLNVGLERELSTDGNMAVQIVTDFRVLMQKAYALGKAKQGGDEAEISAAQADHDAYRDLCLNAEKMNLGIPYGAL